jgi:hypothetical protein
MQFFFSSFLNSSQKEQAKSACVIRVARCKTQKSGIQILKSGKFRKDFLESVQPLKMRVFRLRYQ